MLATACSSSMAIADNVCMTSFNETRENFLSQNSQSVIVQSTSAGIVPYVTLQVKSSDSKHYALWQTLNGDVRGYALRNQKGFDYTNNRIEPMPLTWHPTLIWDKLFASHMELKNYSCVLTGRTRVMGKRVTLLRLIPQEGLRYSYLIAKEDDVDFPVELTVFAPNGSEVNRLTTMDSRIIGGIDFPIQDNRFDSVAHPVADQSKAVASASGLAMQDKPNAQGDFGENSSTLLQKNMLTEEECSAQDSVLPDPTKNAGVVVLGSAAESKSLDKVDIVEDSFAHIWPELNIPEVFTLVSAGPYPEGGRQCFYQEFSDGLLSFRVYRNTRSSIYYPVVSNTTLTVLRRNNMRNEFSVVGEVPLPLAEYVLSRINERKNKK